MGCAWAKKGKNLYRHAAHPKPHKKRTSIWKCNDANPNNIMKKTCQPRILKPKWLDLQNMVAGYQKHGATPWRPKWLDLQSVVTENHNGHNIAKHRKSQCLVVMCQKFATTSSKQTTKIQEPQRYSRTWDFTKGGPRTWDGWRFCNVTKKFVTLQQILQRHRKRYKTCCNVTTRCNFSKTFCNVTKLFVTLQFVL